MSHLRPLALTGALLLLASLALADTATTPAPSLEDRLRALEERVRLLEDENARLKAAAEAAPATPPPAAVPAAPATAAAPAPPAPAAPAVAQAEGREEKLKVGGMLQIQGEAGDRGDARFPDDHERFLVRRARVSVGGQFMKDVQWRTELELAGTLSSTSGLRAQLTDGYLDWRRGKPAGLRVGQFKTPFGFEQLTSDSKLPTIERTLGSDRLTLGRQPGLQVGGSVQKERLTWSVGAFNGVTANQSGNDDDHMLLATRVAGVPWKGQLGGKDARWSLAMDAYRSRDTAVSMAGEFGFDSTPSSPGADNIFRGRRAGLGIDSQFAVGPVEIWGAWINTEFEPESAIPEASFDARATTGQVAWNVRRDTVQLVARWDAFDPDRERRDDDTRTWTTGATWFIRGHDLKLQANWMEISAPEPHGSEGKLILRLQMLF